MQSYVCSLDSLDFGEFVDVFDDELGTVQIERVVRRSVEQIGGLGKLGPQWIEVNVWCYQIISFT